MTWHCAKTETPEAGRRIVTLYDDGSGSQVFFVAEGGDLYDTDSGWWTLGWLQAHHGLFAYLPDDFRLWCEVREDDPVDFSKIKPEGER